ncbi:MAG: 3-deoxy-D-manno-octulosonic acid transferase [Paracoccaceae bacterium]
MGLAVDRVRRFALGKGGDVEPERRDEPLGQTRAVRPEGKLVWLMSETAAAAGPGPALAKALTERLEEEVHVLCTPLDEDPLVASVEHDVIHQFGPTDTDGTVTRFLDHWRPDFGVVIGYPPRPNLFAAAKKRQIPLFHTAAARGGTPSTRRLPSYLGCFDTCFAPSASEANILRTYLRGKETRVEITGPMSDTVYALPCNMAECDDLAKLLGGRPVWLAAQVTDAEIDVIEAAHRKAFRSAHRLLLVIVPLDVAQGHAIAERLEAQGWRVALRSQLQEPDPETQVYLADTEDELGLWYRLAPTSFVGGSLTPGSTPTDPFDAAALGSAVLHGPILGPNPARFQALDAHSASLRVTNAEDLADAVITLLAPDKAASLAQAGWTVTTESAHVVERIADVLEERVHALEDEV